MDPMQQVENTSAKNGEEKTPTNHLRQFIEYHYVVLCRFCGNKVLDPDKKKNQTHLKGKCPSCGKDSVEEKKNKKKHKKHKGHRAKY